MYTAVFTDQRPHVWNEELLGCILLDIFKLQIRKFLNNKAINYS